MNSFNYILYKEGRIHIHKYKDFYMIKVSCTLRQMLIHVYTCNPVLSMGTSKYILKLLYKNVNRLMYYCIMYIHTSKSINLCIVLFTILFF